MSVVMAPPTRKTAEDLLAMPDEGAGYELVRGELREREMSKESGHVGGTIFTLIRAYVYPRRLGSLYPSDVGFTLKLDSGEYIKKPDVAFFVRERLTREQYWAHGFSKVVPDFVIEVLSPNDKASDVQDKREEWQEAGVKLVWLVDPGDETIRVYSLDKPVKLFNSTDTINAEPVIPGFTCLVSDFFAEPPLADN